MEHLFTRNNVSLRIIIIYLHLKLKSLAGSNELLGGTFGYAYFVHNVNI